MNTHDGRTIVSTDTSEGRRDALRMIVAPIILGGLGAFSAAPSRAFAQDGGTPPTPQKPDSIDPDFIDPEASPYPTFIVDPAAKGTVRCVGSSAVALLLNAIRGDFRGSQPAIELEVVSSGSGSAPKALAAGESDLAPMSRAMRDSEIAAIEKARGVPVRFIDIALDAIAICVNRQNPIERMTLKDLDRVFGRERRRGGGPATIWGDVGVRAAGFSNRAISLFGMGAGTGSNGIVQETILLGGEFRTSVNEEPVSSSVVQGVATDPGAIGYCSAYFTSGRARPARVRELEIESEPGGAFVAPTDEAIRSGRYPLARALRLYFVDDPKRPSPATRQLLRFLLSEDGQTLIGDLGQRTLAPEAAHRFFDSLK
jgi:phosphate transport system substrate-binding protein